MIKMVSDHQMIQILKRAKICPIIHAPSWQAEHGLQDRFYTIYLSGRFGICDNLGAIDIFGEEIREICTENPAEYIKKTLYFLENPEKQLKYIKIIQDKIKNKFNFYTQWGNILNKLKLKTKKNNNLELLNEIKKPYFGLEKIKNFDDLINLKYSYIYELKLIEMNKMNYKNYYYYKLCKRLSKGYSEYTNKKFLDLISCNKFEREILANQNLNYKKIHQIINYHLNTNFSLIKKYDIRYDKVCKHYANIIFNKENIVKDNKINKTDKLLTFIIVLKDRSKCIKIN